MKQALAGMLILVTMAGCAATRPAPQIDPAGLDSDAFLAWLADQPMVGAAEAYRAMLLLATQEDPGYDWDVLQREAFARRIARPEWKLGPDTAIDKATASYMAAQVLSLPGGINLNLFGRALHLGDRRYAFREVVREGLLHESYPYEVITGGEFVALISRADAWNEVDEDVDLPGAPAAPPDQPGA